MSLQNFQTLDSLMEVTVLSESIASTYAQLTSDDESTSANIDGKGEIYNNKTKKLVLIFDGVSEGRRGFWLTIRLV